RPALPGAVHDTRHVDVGRRELAHGLVDGLQVDALDERQELVPLGPRRAELAGAEDPRRIGRVEDAVARGGVAQVDAQLRTAIRRLPKTLIPGCEGWRTAAGVARRLLDEAERRIPLTGVGVVHALQHVAARCGGLRGGSAGEESELERARDGAAD